MSFTEFIISKGISPSEWNTFRDENYKITGFENTCVVTETTLRNIGKERSLYLVSNNSQKTIIRILNEMSIPKHLFECIYSSNDMINLYKKCTKKHIYQHIKAELGCSYQDMLAIGDRYISDLKPLIDFGGNGILVDSPTEIEGIALILN